VRTFRTTLKEEAESDESPVVLKNTEVAWGYMHPGPPGW